MAGSPVASSDRVFVIEDVLVLSWLLQYLSFLFLRLFKVGSVITSSDRLFIPQWYCAMGEAVLMQYPQPVFE